MGKKRITQLLGQLDENQQKDLQNAAAIFTVAQVAVNGLSNQKVVPSASPTAALPPSPVELDKTELLRRYGSYNGCRKAAKGQGIRFSRSPSWDQLVTAFSYREGFQQLVQSYIEHYPTPNLKGVSFELKIN